MFAQIYGAPRRRVAEVVELFGLGQFMKRSKSQLSSGQKTLIGLARSLLHRPRLLILDEPTASLDPEVAQRVRTVLQGEQRRDGFTLLVTSHNMADVERMLRVREPRQPDLAPARVEQVRSVRRAGEPELERPDGADVG